jgi:hypothetical protein
MKLFDRSGGHWLFWSGVLYLSLTALVALSPYSDYTILVQLVWFILIALPLICNPLARWLNMKENHMFDWMKKNKMPENVVPFPVPAPRLVEPADPKEKDPDVHYTIGHTSDNRVAFKLGYSTLMMNHQGVQTLIDQLEFFQSQLHQDTDGQPN